MKNPIEDKSIFKIAKILGALSERWLKKKYVYRQKAVTALVKSLGWTRAMAETCLDDIFSELTEKKILRLLKSELPHPKMLDGFVFNDKTRRFEHARGPELILHLIPANVPNPGIVTVYLGLLCKSINACRISSRDSGLLEIFVKSLATIDPKLAQSVFLFEGNGRHFKKFVQRADLVVVYGEDKTLEEVRKQSSPKARFIGFGDRESFGMVSKEILTRKNLRRLGDNIAQDVWKLDQRGCLSAVRVYAERGGEVSPEDLGNAIAAGLAKMNYPRKNLERAVSHRHLAELWKLVNERYKAGWCCVSDPLGQWIVLGGDMRTWKSNSQKLKGQCVGVVAVEDLFATLKGMRSLKNSIQGVFLEAPPDKRAKIAGALAMLGASRVCAAGKLQTPPLDWHHEGLARFSSWLSFTDAEMDIRE